MTEQDYKCARCGSPVHDYSDADQRAACETCTDWVPVTDDPTPYCTACGARTAKQCDCGPIAEND